MRYLVGILLLGGLLAGDPSAAHGQQERQFGLVLGGNWATLASPTDNLEGHFAVTGGVVLRQPLYGLLSVQPELLFSQKGTTVQGDDGGSVEYSAGYLELPVLLHLKSPSVMSVTVHAEAGGFGAVKIFEQQSPGSDLSIDTGVSFFHRFDAGVLAGVGATIPIRGRSLNLTVRREWGVPDVAQDVDDQPFSVPFPAEGRTRTWSLLLRLGF